MTVTATPTVTVGGSPLPGAPVGGAIPSVVLVQSLTVRWGRASLLEQPTPALADLVVLDTSPTRTFAARRDLIGQPVVIAWTGSDGVSATLFRGRITAAPVRPHTGPDGAIRGLLVQVSASSLEVDLANATVPEGAVWPTETFAARLARILALLPAGGVLSGGAVLPLLPTGTNAAQVTPGGADALALLRTLYDSCGVAMVYQPENDVMGYADRRVYSVGTSLGASPFSAELFADPDRGGRWAAPGRGAAGNHLDARRIGYDGAAGQSMTQRLTAATFDYFDAANAWAQATAVVSIAGTDEAVYGRRVLPISTVHTSAAAATSIAGTWASIAATEGALPTLEPLNFSTARTPFPDSDTAQQLLTGSERPTWWFLRRSWLPALGVPPLVGFIGATISYTAGQWSIDAQPAPCVNTAPGPGLRIRYAAASSAVRLVDLDDSLTLADTAHVQIGAGYTAATMPT